MKEILPCDRLADVPSNWNYGTGRLEEVSRFNPGVKVPVKRKLSRSEMIENLAELRSLVGAAMAIIESGEFVEDARERPGYDMVIGRFGIDFEVR